MKRLIPLILMAALALPANGQAAKLALADEPRINQDLIAGAEGDILRKMCPKVSIRMFVVWNKLYALKAYAEEKGYTEDEVKLFLKDKAQKKRVKAAAADYLAKAGAVKGDVESYCQVARDEVAKGTLLGGLITVGD